MLMLVENGTLEPDLMPALIFLRRSSPSLYSISFLLVSFLPSRFRFLEQFLDFRFRGVVALGDKRVHFGREFLEDCGLGVILEEYLDGVHAAKFRFPVDEPFHFGEGFLVGVLSHLPARVLLVLFNPVDFKFQVVLFACERAAHAFELLSYGFVDGDGG